VVVPANEAVPNLLLRQAREARNLTQDEVARMSPPLLKFGDGPSGSYAAVVTVTSWT
jgi:hypothetical protein